MTISTKDARTAVARYLAKMKKEPKEIYNPPFLHDDNSRNLHLIAMRLRVRNGDQFPFPHISTYAGLNSAYVFVVNKKGQAVTLSDDPGLFPSDDLITQLRLLMG